MLKEEEATGAERNATTVILYSGLGWCRKARLAVLNCALGLLAASGLECTEQASAWDEPSGGKLHHFPVS